MRFLALLFVPLAFAAICPMEKHQECNENSENLICTCSVAQEEESPVREVSCNALISRDLETGEFPVVSIEFNLDKSTEGLTVWPEEAFREKISSSLRVDEEDIFILRAGCTGTDDSLTVQFVVLKKDTNSSATPFEIEDLIDAESIATRMKAMGHLSQIANLDVDTIEYTEELIDLEYDPSNVKLFIQATLLGLVFGIFFILGIYKVFHRGEDYSDDLQKV